MNDKGQRWLWALLINVALAQASIYVMRPMITYRALENGATGYQIGLIASIYALHEQEPRCFSCSHSCSQSIM